MTELETLVAFCQRALDYKDAYPNCGGVMPEVDFVKAREMAADYLRANGPGLLADARDAARWRKLVADTNGYGIKHPCLRDDLSDWAVEQGFDPWATTPEAGEGG